MELMSWIKIILEEHEHMSLFCFTNWTRKPLLLKGPWRVLMFKCCVVTNNSWASRYSRCDNKRMLLSLQLQTCTAKLKSMESNTLSSKPKLLCLIFFFFLGGHVEPFGTFMIRVRENNWHVAQLVVLTSLKGSNVLKEFIALIVTQPEQLSKDTVYLDITITKFTLGVEKLQWHFSFEKKKNL